MTRSFGYLFEWLAPAHPGRLALPYLEFLLVFS